MEHFLILKNNSDGIRFPEELPTASTEITMQWREGHEERNEQNK